MPPALDITLQQKPPLRRRDVAEPLRRKGVRAPRRSFAWRRILNFFLLFVTVVLVADGLIGEKGFMDTMRARQKSRLMHDSLARLRDENARLQALAEQLRHDPATIESIAREELGLLRPGEVLVILKDANDRSRP